MGRTLFNKRQTKEVTQETAKLAYIATQNDYSTQSDIASVTLTNAPPGDYIVSYWASCMPYGGGNASIMPVLVTGGGTLDVTPLSIHSGADADYNTGKWLHRAKTCIYRNHPGGDIQLNLRLSPESAVGFRFGNAGDSRWARGFTIAKAG